MGNMVGLSRAVKTEWLDKAAELASQLEDTKQIKDALNEYLSFEIESPTNMRKTREILLKVWCNSSPLQQDALRAYCSVGSHKAALHWSMILLAYPVFSDVCALIGKISLVQDTFTTAWLKEKLLEIWGERPTLIHASHKLLQTLKMLGAIESEKSGVYKVCRQQVKDSDTVKVMTMALIALNRKAYYEIPELSREPLFFPFEYEVSHELIHNEPKLRVSYFGGKMVVGAESK